MHLNLQFHGGKTPYRLVFNIVAWSALLGITASFPLNAQVVFFERTATHHDRSAIAVKPALKEYQVIRWNEPALRTYLHGAPLESESTTGLPLSVPLPDGQTETFMVVESPLLSPQQAALHPDIKTYTGQSRVHPERVIRFSLTRLGFAGLALNINKDAVYFEPYSGDPTLCVSYFVRHATRPEKAPIRQCGHADQGLHIPGDTRPKADSWAADRNNTGGTLRTYRLAMAGNGEFTALYAGDIDDAYAAIVNYANNMALVYRIELCISFQLISGTEIVFDDPDNDPFSNDDQVTMLDENQDLLDIEYSSSGYDVGHVLGYTGGSGGGIAATGSVCYDDLKGSGVSGIGNINSYPQVFFDQLIYHEVGHQFGMSHSYNSSIPVCTTREPDTSVEPGSGATIMSYGFTCSDNGNDDDYESYYQPILQFHTVNYEQAYLYVTNPIPGYGGCSVNTSTGNSQPVLTVPSTKNIPKSTPFMLTGSATDATPGDGLTYCWEGTNIGLVTPDESTLSDLTQPPFFRSYSPETEGTRIYPLLESILDFSYYRKGNKLPSVGIATTHRLVVRDNVMTGGSTAYANVTVNVDDNSGPFYVLNLSGDPFEPNSVQTVEWDVANTTNAPVSCAQVDILMSTDGGNTFPYTLATNVPNNGSYNVTLPNLLTNTARIMVRASNNIFFDISNNFEIDGILPVTLYRFDATLRSPNEALLHWEISLEEHTKGYEVEVAQNDATTFKYAGWMPARHAEEYEYSLKSLSEGTWYFRLKIIDDNGTFSYSPIRSLQIGGASVPVLAYPNPATSILHLQTDKGIEAIHQVQIMNALGQIVTDVPRDAQGQWPTTIQVGHLPAGAYRLTLKGDAFQKNIPWVKQ